MTNDDVILVAIDSSEAADTALARAAFWGRALDARIVLLACVYDPYLAGTRYYDGDDLRRAREALLKQEVSRLESLATPLHEAGLAPDILAVWDTPEYEGIVRQAMELEPRLVVKQTHFHGKLERAIFGHTDWQLIRTCPAPLLLVKEAGYHDPLRIRAAVDPLQSHDKPAELDDRIIETAAALRDAAGADFGLVHAVDDIAPLAAAASGGLMPNALPLEELEETLRERHAKRLAALAADYDIPHDRVRNLNGAPERVLPEFVRREDVDVLVIGSVARGPLKRAIIGSTSEKVLDRIPCDLLVVKPGWFESPVGQSRDLMKRSDAHGKEAESPRAAAR